MAKTVSGERVVLYMRVAAELYERIVAVAEADRRKINTTAEILIEEALKAREEKQS
jgi:hypothetical protein